ncbi:MAG: hypothetical protein KGZ82_08675 [Bacteroidales bacterium]|nr:hypothetical protein [Bacteroidales bacterium]
MKEHRYILQPYNGSGTRFLCPRCQSRNKTFSRYIDSYTGIHLNPTVGRCNRETNCGYHYTPKQYFTDNNISINSNHDIPLRPPAMPHVPEPLSYIPPEIFMASLNPDAYSTNNFVSFLITLFGNSIASELVSRYFIATSNHWSGATVFWQIDTNGKIRTGKIMLYDPESGKRIKEPFNHIYWAHKAINQPGFVLGQCLFGEHLLSDKTRPVAIVESEKTAIIASAYLPQFLWLATGSLSNLSTAKCSILKGRSVLLFPDLRAHEKWSEKATELSESLPGTSILVSDLLERKASESDKASGLDLADFLIKHDWRQFTQQSSHIQQLPATESNKNALLAGDHENPWSIHNEHFPVIVTSHYDGHIDNTTTVQPLNWSLELSNLEHHFNSIPIPSQPIIINHCCTLTDIPAFIASHLSTLRANSGNPYFLPYLSRLIEVKHALSKPS